MTESLAVKIKNAIYDRYNIPYNLTIIKEMIEITGNVGIYSNTKIYSMRRGLNVYIVYVQNENVIDVKLVKSI